MSNVAFQSSIFEGFYIDETGGGAAPWSVDDIVIVSGSTFVCVYSITRF